MNFCSECGSMLPAGSHSGECDNCGASYGGGESESPTDSGIPEADGGKETGTKLESLPTTKSGTIPKSEAMEWLEDLDNPSSAELKRATIEKPNDFEGSTFPTDISNIRLTGDANFIETVAGLFSWITEMEDYSRRVEVNLKETEDKESGEQTGNYALYLSVAERG